MFEYANTNTNTSPEINFIYWGNKEIYCIFDKTHCISVFFSTKCNLLNNFVFFCPHNIFFMNYHNIFFMNYALKFKYRPQYARG